MPNWDIPVAEWQDAGRAAYWAFEQLDNARTLGEQGAAMIALSNAMADLVTWIPGWDYEKGILHEDSSEPE